MTPYNNYSINKLLNLKGVLVKKIVHKDKSVDIHLETIPKVHTCPCCGKETKRIHDYRTQRIKDLPFQLKDTYLILRKRRYRCSCGKKFYEKYSFISRYKQRTTRLNYEIINQLRDTVSMKHVASKTNVSNYTVARLIDTINYEPPKLDYAIAIDEFKGNADTGKYQCILVNPIKHNVMDILPDRTTSHLSSYFSKLNRSERYRVKFFVCDMWQPYVDIAKTYFPNAKVIIDKYHFRRQLTWAIDRIRKRLQKSMPAYLRKYYKRSRFIIHKPYSSLSKEDKERCNIMLLYNDDLRRAHSLKEWFNAISNESKYSVLRKELFAWLQDAETCGIKELEDVAATYRRWIKGILNAFKYNLSNGVTEGFNNKIKVLKRNSYGIKDFKRFRTRILHTTN